MVQKILSLFKELTDSDKVEIFTVITVLLFGTVAVLLGIAWSRGNDVDYFKERLIMLENRFTVSEKARHDITLRIADVEKKVQEVVISQDELRNYSVTEITRLENMLRTRDPYRNLPVLPQPPIQPPSKLRPIR